jgi:aryl-alcohol dehydrogenase-like predicted oxidoreductase
MFIAFGKSNLRVSSLCLGTMTMGWQNDERESHAILDRAWDAGINFFDTADIYSRWVEGNPGGVSETILGHWLKGKPREQLVIATKAWGKMWDGPDGEGLSRSHLMRACDDSLKRLGLETIDLYQCHAPDPNTPIEETVSALGELVKAGKVRTLGVSNFTAEQTKNANDFARKNNLPEFICTQPKYNLVCRSRLEGSLEEYCCAENIAVIPYSPLEGGLLTGKYRAGQTPPENARHTLNQTAAGKLTPQVVRTLEMLQSVAHARGETMTQTALAWCATNPAVTSPIIGATSLAQLNDGLGALGKKLSAEEYRLLNDVSAGL